MEHHIQLDLAVALVMVSMNLSVRGRGVRTGTFLLRSQPLRIK